MSAPLSREVANAFYFRRIVRMVYVIIYLLVFSCVADVLLRLYLGWEEMRRTAFLMSNSSSNGYPCGVSAAIEM